MSRQQLEQYCGTDDYNNHNNDDDNAGNHDSVADASLVEQSPEQEKENGSDEQQ